MCYIIDISFLITIGRINRVNQFLRHKKFNKSPHFALFSHEIPIMCEATETYVWDLRDNIGNGATSIVYKAYNKTTGGSVAAKSPRDTTKAVSHQSREAIQREINFLKDISHKNVVQFMAMEPITSTDHNASRMNREILFLEYCNGGSVGDMLKLPENRYGLSESTLIHIMKDVTNALKYLRSQNIIHRDFKPDNILRSVDLNGAVIYKLTDLGFARLINQNELGSYSICGTEEYIHPVVYSQVFPAIKVKIDETTSQTREPFPFEVEMWSFGVTLYQCATGKIPFQPYEGARNDRGTMRRILNSIPKGNISGIQNALNGAIDWSQKLPDYCRLSSSLKQMLEQLLARLFETDYEHLMQHEKFFIEIEKIVNLVPIYYLNLKKFNASCLYFQSDQPIKSFFDRIRDENGDNDTVDYYYFFQNAHYSVPSDNELTVKQYLSAFPTVCSHEKPLIIYSLSLLDPGQDDVPKMSRPNVQEIFTLPNTYYSAYSWSQEFLAFVYYSKAQLSQYELILQMIQLSTSNLREIFHSKIVQLLSSIEEKLTDFRIINELKNIADAFEMKTNAKVSANKTNTGETTTSAHSNNKSIISECQMNVSYSEHSSENEERTLFNMNDVLKSSNDVYRKLTDYHEEVKRMLNIYFNNQSNHEDCHQILCYTTKSICEYSSKLPAIDTYLQYITPIRERFRQDINLATPNTMQTTVHNIRRHNLDDTHKRFNKLIEDEFYPMILKFFNEYTTFIKKYIDIGKAIKEIQNYLSNQCPKHVSINDYQRIILAESQSLNKTQEPMVSDSATSIEFPQGTIVQATNNDNPATTIEHSEYKIETPRIDLGNIHLTIQDTLKRAENCSNMLKDIIDKLC